MSVDWRPLYPEIEPILRDKQPAGFRWPKAKLSQWVEPIHSPLREDKHPSFSVRPDSPVEPGAWKDHATEEGGSIADLARRLGIDPRVSGPQKSEKILHAEGLLERFCRIRKLDLDVLINRWNVAETTFHSRSALRFQTRVGIDRIKFLDGEKPKCSWAEAGGAAHLYGLGAAVAITNGSPLYIVNGEPSVWACNQSNVPAVCMCAGETVALSEDMVRDITRAGIDDIRVAFDLDSAGERGASKLVAHLRKAGFKASAVKLPAHLGPGGDVDDLHRQVGDGGLAKALSDLPEIGGVGVIMSDVESENVRWAWRGRIPLGKITVLDGDPGLGKSVATLDLAARVSRGTDMPDGSAGPTGGVVLLSAEDGLADTIRPRLEMHGADLGRILALHATGEGENRRPLSLPDDLGIVRQAIERVDACLVVVDPLMAFLNGGIDSHRDQDVRRALAAMAAMAEETAVALVIVRHLNKTAVGNPIYRGGGSIGIIGAARAGLLVALDPKHDDVRVLAPTKSNLGPPPDSLAFILDDIGGRPRIRWLGVSEHTAESLLAPRRAGRAGGALTRAMDFLEEELAGSAVKKNEIAARAEERNISEATLRRAANELGVRKRKVGVPGGEGQHWVWELPCEDDSEDDQDDHGLNTFDRRSSLRSEDDQDDHE